MLVNVISKVIITKVLTITKLINYEEMKVDYFHAPRLKNESQVSCCPELKYSFYFSLWKICHPFSREYVENYTVWIVLFFKSSYKCLFSYDFAHNVFKIYF